MHFLVKKKKKKSQKTVFEWILPESSTNFS